MALSAGTRLGPYEILSPLGAGGMGEVYRARDTRLGRDVAVKVLPQHLSENPEVRARFEREAKTVSSLNHPNICTLFDVGREGDTDYLVLELVEGDTLDARLSRGALAPAELLRLGTQVADALDRAHRAGVIHRDLKPGNVMLTRSGAKLMDFGLARATGLGSAGSDSARLALSMAQSPTMAKSLTAEGTLLGTFQYMSPEQLEGREADARSDIWALGCVLYEMATGRRAFEGRSQASLIAAILEREPPPITEAPSGSTVVPAGGMPYGLDRLIRHCLNKDPEERIQTAHDVKLQLQGIAESAGLAGTGVGASSAMAAASGTVAGAAVAGHAGHVAGGAGARGLAGAGAGSSRLAWGVAVAAVLAAVALGVVMVPRALAPRPVYRYKIEPTFPGMAQAFWPRLSPDGRALCFLGVDSLNVGHAFVMRMDETTPQPVGGTENLRRPYWSPDSREIAFVSGGKLQRVPVSGGTPVVICAAPSGSDLSWGAKGSILLDGRTTDSLLVVPAAGGELRPATRIDRKGGELGSAWPCFLPDGEHFLFIGTLGAAAGGGNIRLGKLGSLDSKLLGRSDGRVEYAPGGWVLFVRDRTLFAQKIDLGAGKLTGQPITIIDDLRVGTAAGHFSVSNTGVLAFSRAASGQLSSIQAVDRQGQPVGPPFLTGAVSSPRLSPDGRRVLYLRDRALNGQGEVSVYDLGRGTDTKLTFTNLTAVAPLWSPDGTRFAYVTRPGIGKNRILLGSADGLGAQDSILVPDGTGALLSQWAGAGNRLVFASNALKVFAVPADGSDRAIHPLGDSTRAIAQGVISPDGRWLASTQGSNPNLQVYVQSLEGPPGRWQISTTTGIFPRWTRGGRELVYETMDGQLMAVDIDTAQGFHPGTPRRLFSLPASSFDVISNGWDCDAAGEKFLVLVPQRAVGRSAMEVVTDFNTLVMRK